MSFASPAFWLFCLVAVGLAWVTPARGRWVTLLGASYAFYGSFGLDILGVLVLLTAGVYLVSRAMARSTGGRRRLWLALDIGLPLAALVVFKYLDLFWQALASVAAPFLGDAASAEPFNLLVPIGISFYVFKLISYALEVYHRRVPPEDHAGYFALYVAFFPQILAGPIERPGSLLPQLRHPARFDAVAAFAGVRLMAWGLFKKVVVAERLAQYVGEVFAAPEYKSFHLVIAAWFYYIQIYCDFSGYSDISVGISRTMGLAPPPNFDYPYLSRDVGDFWRRWHITLSTWLRDYLFLPIAYAVTRRAPEGWLGVKGEAWAYGIATMATMLLGGLWHGAAWTFVVWGGLHAVFLVGSYATRRGRRRAARAAGLPGRPRLHAAVRVAITFNLVALAWIPFRATSFENLLQYLHYMQLKLPPAGLAHVLFNSGLVAVFLALEYVQRNPARFPRLQRAPMEVRAVGYAAFVVAMIVLSVDSANPFIYFRF